jgi:hypothetical protein
MPVAIDWSDCLGYTRACDLCPAVRQLHEARDDQAEYGINWYAFLATCEEDIYPLLNAWWATVPQNLRRDYLAAALRTARETLDRLTTLDQATAD